MSRMNSLFLGAAFCLSLQSPAIASDPILRSTTEGDTVMAWSNCLDNALALQNSDGNATVESVMQACQTQEDLVSSTLEAPAYSTFRSRVTAYLGDALGS